MLCPFFIVGTIIANLLSGLITEFTSIKQMDKPFIESLRYNTTIENTEFRIIMKIHKII